MAKWYGSVNNRMEEGVTFGDKKPYVGMGATEYLWSDRHAYEVVEVIDDKHVVVRRCDAKRIDNNGMSESQEYAYTLQPYKEWDDCFGRKCNNNVKLVFMKKSGWRERLPDGKLGTNKFSLGVKKEYYDFSF